jgi:CDP-diacylglycerol--glycerol-3-phosphate 3-phosphatidyltransferase
VAAATDFFDGQIARKYKCESNFGIVFDSMLDKVLILSMMMLLIPYKILPVGIWVLFFIREMVVDSIKSFLSSQGKPIKARSSGKLKMVSQVALVGMGIIRIVNNSPGLVWATDVTAGVSLFLSYYSAYFYVRDFWKKNGNTNLG